MNRFDEAAKTWDSKPSSLAIAKACVSNINENITLDEKAHILDYGSGTGLVAFSLSTEKNQVLGMDSSQGMVHEFNKKARELNFTNIHALEHNINEQNLPKEGFDLIVTSMTLHHIKNTAMFIEKSLFALKSGGYLCINDLDEEDGTFHKKHNNDGVEHFGFNKEELVSIVGHYGLKIIDYKIVYIDNRENKDFPIFNLIAQKI